MGDIARHEIIDILLIQKNSIRQRLKGITLLKIFCLQYFK